MKKIGIFFFPVMLAALNVCAGGNRFLMDTVIKTAKADTDTVQRKQSLSVGVSLGSDAQFFGRTGPQKYPFMNTDVIYNAKSGFFVYGSLYKVFTSTPLIDETDLGAGYFYKFSPSFTGNVSYTRFI